MIIEAAALARKFGSEPHRSLVRLKLADEHVQQSRFASAIRACNTHAVAAMNADTELIDNCFCGERFRDGLGLDHELAGLFGFRIGRSPRLDRIKGK